MMPDSAVDEFEELRLDRDSPLGWCEHTPPNETVDAEGRPTEMGEDFQPDPFAPRRRAYDDPDVTALRSRLRARNGIAGLEICLPQEVERATRIFFRDGFVVLRDVIEPAVLERFRKASAERLREILRVSGPGRRKYMTETGRHPHRYSYGFCSASRELLHDPTWAAMVDLPTTTPLLTALFGGEDYHVLGAGGDLCLPGAIEYQELHRDMPHLEAYEPTSARQRQAERFADLPGLPVSEDPRRVLALSPPCITINFPMIDFTWENGPIRQIPGSQTNPLRPPSHRDEPDWMRFSTLVGVPAGSAIFRDTRAWHGGTPNLSRQVRAMPNVEYGAPWLDGSVFARTMPHEIWEGLSPHAQGLCRRVKAEPGILPAGAGIMHPLAGKREEAKFGSRSEKA